jgi:hypothetical protein
VYAQRISASRCMHCFLCTAQVPAGRRHTTGTNAAPRRTSNLRRASLLKAQAAAALSGMSSASMTMDDRGTQGDGSAPPLLEAQGFVWLHNQPCDGALEGVGVVVSVVLFWLQADPSVKKGYMERLTVSMCVRHLHRQGVL